MTLMAMAAQARMLLTLSRLMPVIHSLLRCPEVGLTESAVSVTETSRRFEIDGDELNYDVAMAAVGQPLTHHLRATLRRA